MPGPAPKHDDERRRRNQPVTGWNETELVGWQHGNIPTAPRGLTAVGKKAWRAWFSAWWASWWTPQDVPQLELAVVLYEKAMEGDAPATSKFQALADSLGLTPKGRYALRWSQPALGAGDVAPVPKGTVTRLKVVDDAPMAGA